MVTVPFNATRCQRHLPVDIWGGLEKRDQFILLDDLEVELPDQRWIIIPKGFVSDGASIPPLLWSILPFFDNRIEIVWVLHDYLYIHWEKTQIITTNPRLYADKVMYTMSKQYDPAKLFRHKLYYMGVRLGGKANWEKFRKIAQL